MVLTKECNDCKQVLPLSKFRSHKNQSGSSSYRCYCRDCERKQSQERYRRQKAQPDIKNTLFQFTDFYRKTKA